MATNTSSIWEAAAKTWRNVYDLYPEVMKVKAAKKTKPAARKELLELDDWYQKDLPAVIASRSKPHITYEELKKLMKWKLARGKFRPALPGLVASNDAAEVETATKKGLGLLPDLEKAIKAVSVLRGVGPATASAILAAGAPDTVPFMADESVLAIPGLTTIKYDLNCYLFYAEAVQELTERLRKEDPASDWTVHQAELALWTHAIASRDAPDLLPPPDGKEGKRKSTGDDSKSKRRK